jgi:hypothetical protein
LIALMVASPATAIHTLWFSPASNSTIRDVVYAASRTSRSWCLC